MCKFQAACMHGQQMLPSAVSTLSTSEYVRHNQKAQQMHACVNTQTSKRHTPQCPNTHEYHVEHEHVLSVKNLATPLSIQLLPSTLYCKPQFWHRTNHTELITPTVQTTFPSPTLQHDDSYCCSHKWQHTSSKAACAALCLVCRCWFCIRNILQAWQLVQGAEGLQLCCITHACK